MTYPIVSVKKVAATSAAQEVAVDCRNFVIKNASASATVYFCEAANGEASASTGFPVSPGETLPVVLNANALSVSATAAADVYLLFVGEGW